MKRIKSVVLLIIIILEFCWILYCFDGVSLFLNNPHSETFRFTLSLSIHALLMLVITTSGMVRIKKRENFSLIKNIMMLGL